MRIKYHRLHHNEAFSKQRCQRVEMGETKKSPAPRSPLYRAMKKYTQLMGVERPQKYLRTNMFVNLKHLKKATACIVEENEMHMPQYNENDADQKQTIMRGEMTFLAPETEC